MILKTFITGLIENNNYLLIDEKSKEAVLIDCSAYIPEVESILKDYDAKLKYILITHGHFDHVLGINEFHKKFPDTKIYAPIGDKDLIEGINTFINRFVGGLGNVEIPHIDKYIDKNENLTIGSEPIKVIPASGHTKGGVCYFVDDKIFSGDTIFSGSVGRTDLPGGSYEQIRKSVKNIIEKFEDNVPIYTGHGASTTIGYEKLNNPVL